MFNGIKIIYRLWKVSEKWIQNAITGVSGEILNEYLWNFMALIVQL